MLVLRLNLLFLLFFISVNGEIKDKGWWKNTIFYQIYPRSFKDSDGDGIGDLNGIIEKLQHFSDSGIGAVWLSPINTSPMIDFGYDISDFKDIDGLFGSLNDFETLVKKAHELGIKVLMDLVPNHSSDQSDWFIKSLKGVGKYKDYFIWKTGRNNNTSPPNNWLSVFKGPAWKYNSQRDMWYLHQFLDVQPDLNYSNPYVQQEMEEVIKFWLGKGVDGFRIDSINFIYEDDALTDEPLSNKENTMERDYEYLLHPYTKDDIRTYELVRRWRELLDEWSDTHNEPEKVMMTEAYSFLDNVTKFYNYGIHVPMNFYFITDLNHTSKPDDFKRIIEQWIQRVPEEQVANWVMGNHDNKRTATRYPGRGDQMTMIAMILPGIAVTYNGEEIAMEDKTDIPWEDTVDPQACNANPDDLQKLSRDPNRTPFQWDDSANSGFSTANKTWLPVNDNYKTLNLAAQKSTSHSHYQLYQSLTEMRNTSKTLREGSTKVDVLNDNKVLSIIRESGDEAVVLLINFADYQSVSIDLAAYHNFKSNDANVKLSSVGSGITWGSSMDLKTINLPAKASVVLVTKSGGNPNSASFLSSSLNVFIAIGVVILIKLF